MIGKPDIRDTIEYLTGVRPTRAMIRCPLHDDKTASCSVNYTSGLWNCHSCGKAGDSWSLIELKKGVTFKEAVALVERDGLQTTQQEGEVHGNRFTGSGRATARRRDGRKETYKPRFARGQS